MKRTLWSLETPPCSTPPNVQQTQREDLPKVLQMGKGAEEETQRAGVAGVNPSRLHKNSWRRLEDHGSHWGRSSDSIHRKLDEVVNKPQGDSEGSDFQQYRSIKSMRLRRRSESSMWLTTVRTTRWLTRRLGQLREPL